MALHRAGLGAGVLDTDNVRDAGDASAPLRSRSLAVQVRVHAAATRDRMLLDTGAGISRLFFDITNFSKLTHAAQQCARALRAEEFDCRWAHRRPEPCRRRECGKRGANIYLKACCRLCVPSRPEGDPHLLPISPSIARPSTHAAVAPLTPSSRRSCASPAHRSHANHAHT